MPENNVRLCAVASVEAVPRSFINSDGLHKGRPELVHEKVCIPKCFSITHSHETGEAGNFGLRSTDFAGQIGPIGF